MSWKLRVILRSSEFFALDRCVKGLKGYKLDAIVRLPIQEKLSIKFAMYYIPTYDCSVLVIQMGQIAFFQFAISCNENTYLLHLIVGDLEFSSGNHVAW